MFMYRLWNNIWKKYLNIWDMRHLEKLEILIKCLTNTKMCKTQYYLLFLGSLAIIVIDSMWGNFMFSNVSIQYPYGTKQR